MSSVNRSILADYFDLNKNFEIVDAPKPITVVSTKADAKGAVVLDPANCLFARACNRQEHKPALFLRTVAYVRQSKAKVFKYELPPIGRSIVTSFDASGVASYGVPVTLIPPKPARAVGARRGRGGQTGTGSPRTKAQIAAARRKREKLSGYQRTLSKKSA
jgi:hypothetical protein